MERPTAFYPQPPKPEWFMLHATNLSSVSFGSSAGADPPSSSFLKMSVGNYHMYILAHKEWRDAVHDVDNELHQDSLRRRAYDGFKQDLSFEGLTSEATQKIDTPYTVSTAHGDSPLKVVVKMKPKEPTLPKTSALKADKRAAKKALRKERLADQVTTLKAKAKVASSSTILDKVADLVEAKHLKESLVLNKKKTYAAAAAAKLSKTISTASKDLVANIQTDSDGFTVVTRKKGDNADVKVAHLQEVIQAGVKNTYVFADPSVPVATRSAMAGLRKPTVSSTP